MTKYSNNGYSDANAVALFHIANELAESNRLKRFELKLHLLSQSSKDEIDKVIV